MGWTLLLIIKNKENLLFFETMIGFISKQKKQINSIFILWNY
jgi:hypothetical protein